MNKFIFLLFGLSALSVASRVIELSDRFLDIKKDGQWLVMFYAPWCAHCKRIEPVWLHVAQALFNSNVRVGRIDCTRYTSVATEFGIVGFPTILFFKGDEKKVEFNGDRTKEELVNFAHRMSGPPVQQVTRRESLNFLEDTRKIFFIYVGSYTGTLWETYYTVAEQYQPYAFFYSVSHELMNLHTEVKENPSIIVYKDKHYFPFRHENHSILLNTSLEDWVNQERFSSFVKVTKGNFNQIAQSNKYLALAVVSENVLEEIPEDMIVFRDIIESVIVNHRDKYHRFFQFGWVGSPSLANSIAMQHLELPHFIVINSTTQHHHLPDWGGSDKVTADHVVEFLDSIIDETATKYGGDTFLVRGYRAMFDIRITLNEMWKGNPVLTSVLFGLPLGFLSLLLYSTCCADIMDANTEDEDAADLQPGYPHEKKE